MGAIYLASLRREGGFERVLAVKRILPHLADDPAFVAMFEAEARLAARLHHPNVVQIYDFGRVDGDAYLAMEYIDGFDLRSLVELGRTNGQPLPLGLALHIGAECARALDYAWTGFDGRGEPLRIIHRDVSPQNILVSMQGETKLTDFGLAKTLSRDSGSMSGMVKGKLGYMAPEQVRGEEVSPRTDLFSLGAVLYELVAGARLYPPELSVGELVARVSDCRYRAVDEAAPALPRSVADVVMHALARRPDDRPLSAAAYAATLRRVADELALPSNAQQLSLYCAPFSERRRLIVEHASDGTAVARRPGARAAPEPTVVAGKPAVSADPEATRRVGPIQILQRPIDPAAHTLSVNDPYAATTTAPVPRLQAGPASEATVLLDNLERPGGHRRATLRLGPNDLEGLPSAVARRKVRLRNLLIVIGVLALAAVLWLALGTPPTRTDAPQAELPSPTAVAVTPAPAPTSAPAAAPAATPIKAPVVLPPPIVPAPALLGADEALVVRRDAEPMDPRQDRRMPTQTASAASLAPVAPTEPTRVMVRVGNNRQVLEVGRSFVSALTLDGMAIKVKATAASPGRVRFDVGARPFAELHVDGQPKGPTPTSFVVSMGRHTVVLSRQGQPKSSFTVQVKDDDQPE